MRQHWDLPKREVTFKSEDSLWTQFGQKVQAVCHLDNIIMITWIQLHICYREKMDKIP